MRLPAVLVACLLAPACSVPQTGSAYPTATDRVSGEQLAAIEALRIEHKASAIGIGIIENGSLVWTGYYGEQSPGVPTSANTLFNTASVNKAVTTETFLRLASAGLVELDETIYQHYEHPDLADDPRYRELTPRIILTHRTGLLNWPHSYDDNRLAFTKDPGEAFGYSGAGFMILANFLEQKLDRPYPQIVREQVFEPVGMPTASVIQKPWMDRLVVHPLLDDGTFDIGFALDYGAWSSADDLYVTVEDYARFLISVMSGDRISDALAAERLRVQSDLTSDAIWSCDDGAPGLCPSPYGYGIGWMVFGYDGNLNVQHGGNDASEAAIAYFETGTRDGMVVFVNAPSPGGVLLWPRIVDVLDESATFTAVFHHIILKFFGA